MGKFEWPQSESEDIRVNYKCVSKLDEPKLQADSLPHWGSERFSRGVETAAGGPGAPAATATGTPGQGVQDCRGPAAELVQSACQCGLLTASASSFEEGFITRNAVQATLPVPVTGPGHGSRCRHWQSAGESLSLARVTRTWHTVPTEQWQVIPPAGQPAPAGAAVSTTLGVQVCQRHGVSVAVPVQSFWFGPPAVCGQGKQFRNPDTVHGSDTDAVLYVFEHNGSKSCGLRWPPRRGESEGRNNGHDEFESSCELQGRNSSQSSVWVAFPGRRSFLFSSQARGKESKLNEKVLMLKDLNFLGPISVSKPM